MMGSGGERVEEEEEEKVIRKKLALAVKSIQWNYSIFWSLSSTQPGVLEWGDGYYNGDIKTRKTVVQCAERSSEEDEFCSERSEQLRQLYESLSSAETNPQAKRPSASLSPEDLTDAEWYFLVCMSFFFTIPHGLPGRTFLNNQTIWLYNAHHADSKVFSRSLLAKSASIQTVVCFPYFGGVVELGTTELVSEDPNIIQHIKDSLLEIPRGIASKISINERELATNLDYQDIDILEEAKDTHSPDNISSKFETVDQDEEESFMVEGVNGGTSQVQSWKISTSASDCVSQSLTSTKKVNDDYDTKLTSFDVVKDDGHYKRVLLTLLKTSDGLILGPSCRNGKRGSSFVSWKKGELSGSELYKDGSSQRLLKKVIFEVGSMHIGCLFRSREENGMRDKLWSPEVDDIDMNHELLEKRRRDIINERFSILGELVPSTSKVNKVSVLDNTIEYLKELERKVEELESCKEVSNIEETRSKNKPHDVVERTSDNYDDKRIFINKRKKPVTNKRKACDTEEMGAENDQILTKDGLTEDLTVSKIDRNVLIEMRCHWKENLLLEIMDATSNLYLDTHSVQSSKVDGFLSLTIKAQLKQSTKTSVGEIRQALRRVIQKH